MIPFETQDVIGSLRINLLSYLRLSADQINRDHTPTEIEQFKQGRNRLNLIAFIFHFHLPQ